MTEKQHTPVTVSKPRISTIECDLVSGPVRCVARLSNSGQTNAVKAIWRNEVGTAKHSIRVTA